jgi:hypothetical protein
LSSQGSVLVPEHKELTPGTAQSILKDIASQQDTTLQELKLAYNIKL